MTNTGNDSKAANLARNEASAATSRASDRRDDRVDAIAKLVAALTIAATAALSAPFAVALCGAGAGQISYFLAVVLAASTLGAPCALAAIAASAIALVLQSPSFATGLAPGDAFAIGAFVATALVITAAPGRLPRERERVRLFARAARTYSRERDDAREAREALRERMIAQSQWYETALQSLDEGVIATDEQSRIRFLNRAAQRLVQASAADTLGRRIDHVLRMATESGGVDVAPVLRDAIADGCAFVPAEPLMLAGREGVRGAVHCAMTPVRSPTGALAGGVVVLADARRVRRADRERTRLVEIAQQAAAIAVASQRSLELAERKFAAFMEHLPFPAYILGESGDMIFVNDAGQRDAGWRHALADVRLADAGDCVIDVPGEPKRYVDVRFPIRASERTWIGGVSIDVTEQSRAERESRERSDEIAALLRHLPVAIWIARGKTARDVCSNGAARDLGCRREDWPPIRQCIAQRRVVRDAHCETKCDDGVTRTLRMTAVPLFDPNGEPCGALAFAVDATPVAEYEAVISRVSAPAP